MNFKRLSIIFLALVILVFTMSIISASDDMQMNETSFSNSTSSQDNNQTDEEIIPDNTTKEKIETDVQADEKVVKYKKSSYFKIKLQDMNKTLLNNVNLKVTVKSGNTVKVFNVKTNYKGIAQFNTKGLPVGKYSVKITSDDENYTVSKKSKIFVGKKYAATLRFSRVKVLNNNDVIKFRVVYDNDKGKEVTVVFKNKAKFTKIIKVKFTFYNQKTARFFSCMEYSKFKNGKWEMPDKDYSFKNLIYKARVHYISFKTKDDIIL